MRKHLPLVCSLLILVGCGCGVQAMPRMDLKLWPGDSAGARVWRKQSGEAISCGQKEFDGLVCMSYEDLREIHDTLAKCKEWKPGTVVYTRDEGLKVYRRERIRAILEKDHGRR